MRIITALNKQLDEALAKEDFQLLRRFHLRLKRAI